MKEARELRLKYKTPEEQLMEIIRTRRPDFGSLSLKLDFHESQLRFVTILNGEEKIRID